jgi:hypothetical protein
LGHNLKLIGTRNCWVCPLQPFNRDWIGLNPTIVPLIRPLIGRAHANLDWSPQTHDAIYWTKGSQERLTLVPRPPQRPHRLSVRVSGNATPCSSSDSMRVVSLQGNNIKTTTATLQQQQRYVFLFLLVDQIYSSSRFYFQLRIGFLRT